MKRIVLILLAAVILTGCATTPKINWTARVGNYTHDQAILELGPPDKEARLQNGTIVSDWLTQRGQTFVEAEPFFAPPGVFWEPPMYNTTYFPNYYLRLTFAPDGKLKAWKQFAR